jgi:hypothetical protein
LSKFVVFKQKVSERGGGTGKDFKGPYRKNRFA